VVNGVNVIVVIRGKMSRSMLLLLFEPNVVVVRSKVNDISFLFEANVMVQK
jgi:hypothetical protein